MKGLMNVFLDGFPDRESIARQFSNGWDEVHTIDFLEIEMTGYEVVVAIYNQEGYEGDAFVLLRKDGQYYEVNGSHCSCYGLEGQWDPEEVPEEALRRRFVGNSGLYGAQSEAAHVVRQHFGWEDE